MAIASSCTLNLLIRTSNYGPEIPRSSISKTRLANQTIIPLLPSICGTASPTKQCQSLQITNSSNTLEPSMEEIYSSPAGVFIKGLPKSTSEGSLKKAFSQFGDVCQVKICTDRNTKESLGYGYLWFTSEESAQSAVKLMNGKFFDGRFLSVTLSRPPRLYKSWEKLRPYEF